MTRKLHAFQDRAVTIMYEREGVQGVMPMGAGKTVVGLTVLQELLAAKEIRRAVVIAPKRVAALVWPREARHWSHLGNMVGRVGAATGGPKARINAFLDAKVPVLTMGLDNIPWLMNMLKELPDDHPLFDALLIDELSAFKAPRGKRMRAISMQSERFRNIWGLTGTFRPNNEIDQYGPIRILSRRKVWPEAFDPWRMKYFYPTDYQQHNWEIRDECKDKITRDINARSFTVSDADMPPGPKIHTVDHWFELTGAAKLAYQQMQTLLVARYGKDWIFAANAAVASGKLSQIVSGFLYDRDPTPTEVDENGEWDDRDRRIERWFGTEKFDMLFDMLKFQVGSEPTMIGYQYQAELQHILRTFPDMPYLGYGVSDKKAELYEEAWNRRELERMALHPASAGHGLNLQYGGNQFIIFSMPWSAELYDQMIKRIARQGQKAKHVWVHRLLARDTIDEAKVARVEGKILAQEAARQLMRTI